MRLNRSTALPYASVAVLIILMGLFSVHTLTSIYQDIGRHITMGRIIVTTGHIPETNTFSYTNPDFPFVNHHWLGSVALYLGDLAFGLKGLIAVKALIVALAFGLALAAAWRPRLAVPAVVLGLASMFTLVERTDVRPEVLSFLFLAWFLFVLYRKPHSRLVWTLPFVQAVWVNTHIYFFMGAFVVLSWWVGEVARSGRSALMGRRHWLFVGSVALATLCNPHGLFGALYPLTMWSNYGYSIVENQTLFFLRAYHYPIMTSVSLFIGMGLTAVTFILNRRHIRQNIDGVLIALGSGVLALVMIRNFPLFALCMLPVSLHNLDQSGWKWGGRQFIAGMLVILALLGVSIATDQIYAQAGLSQRFGLIVPAGFQAPVDLFRSVGLKGPIFNNFDVGSFLIWKLPEEKVFIDGRPEAYPADFIQHTYIAMQEDPAVWETQSQKYGFNTIFWNERDITPWSQLFVARILHDPDWAIIYRSQGIIILVRNTPVNAALIAKYRVN